jgi:hypothetical protein
LRAFTALMGFLALVVAGLALGRDYFDITYQGGSPDSGVHADTGKIVDNKVDEAPRQRRHRETTKRPAPRASSVAPEPVPEESVTGSPEPQPTTAAAAEPSQTPPVDEPPTATPVP